MGHFFLTEWADKLKLNSFTNKTNYVKWFLITKTSVDALGLIYQLLKLEVLLLKNNELERDLRSNVVLQRFCKTPY